MCYCIWLGLMGEEITENSDFCTYKAGGAKSMEGETYY